MSDDISASAQIDGIIANIPDWRGHTLSQLREIILQTDKNLVEEVKWKKPSKPEGVPVWTCNGNICIADTLKNAVRLTFPKGAQLSDPTHVFNTRLDGNAVRAVDFFEDSVINKTNLQELIAEAIELNAAK